MTLEEKALEYSLKINGFTKEDCYNEKGELFQFIKSDMDIYIAGAKELEQENNRLKKQIEKMKCCQNCKYKDCNKTSQYQTCWYCKNKDKWELQE